MSLLQAHRKSYQAFSIEEATAFVHNVRDRTALQISERDSQAHADDAAWPFHTVTGRPTLPGFTDNFFQKLIIYQDISPVISLALGLGFKRQSLNRADLEAAIEKRVKPKSLQKPIRNYIMRSHRQDASPALKKWMLMNEQLKQAYENFNTIQSGAFELRLFDAALASIAAMGEEFTKYPYLEPFIYISKYIVEFPTASGLLQQCEPKNQHHIQSTARLAENFDEAEQEVAAARPSPEHALHLMRLMNNTRTGINVGHSVTKPDEQVLFVDNKKNEQKLFEATYNFQDGKIRVGRIQHGVSSPEQTEIDHDQEASKLVHEACHKKQQIDFPEMFSEALDLVDQYVAMKLLEAAAFATQDVYEAERAHQTRVWGQSAYTDLEEVAGNAEILTLDENIYRGLHINVEDAAVLGERNWTNYQLTFLERFAYRLAQNPLWGKYEDEFHVPEFIALLTSDKLGQRVAASQFLKPEFLDRFCITPDGQSYLPVNRAPIYATIAKWVATLHHPYMSEIKPVIKQQADRPLGKLDSH